MTKIASPPSQPNNFVSIQMLRGLAAFLIVVWHSDLALELFRADYWRDTHPIYRAQLYPFWANHLSIGVDLFFCISGFVMTLLATKARSNEAWAFLKNRGARILPPYWFFSLCVVALFLIAPTSFHIWMLKGEWSYDTLHTLKSLFLLPQKAAPVLAVGWTLIHEFLFYLFVAAIIWVGQGKHLVFWTGLAALLGVTLCLYDIKILSGYFFSEYYLCFFSGSLAFTLRDRLARFFPSLQIALALALYLPYSYYLDLFLAPIANRLLGVGGSSLIAFLLIIGMLGLERKASFPLHSFVRFWARLGNASYSMYLSHWFSLSLIGKLAIPFVLASVPFVIGWHISAIALTVLFAVVFAERIELPLHRKILSYLGKSAKH